MRDLNATRNHARRQVRFTSRPQCAAEARDAAAAFLAGLHPTPSPHTRQDLILVVSELVTNAMRHAGAVSGMSLVAERRVLQVRVEDPGPARPQGRSPDLTGRRGGFGWPMIQRLARAVAVRPKPDGGKTVLVTLAR
ncbi:ATP-binding protein [Streptomyces sp. NBC_01142]|uniref:ATP-binding protein n=1 Tax=Streptomyces sp. NBC_01142 TaxID=2975865 RepID=UPI0022535D9D|nr:ATP-binding protein [Streptomyces sp. NBC_01142]MCX4825416.1 ATP-binding protein [Streptomyces sp. NBC_01142]